MSKLAETWIKEGMKRGRREGVRKGIEQGIQQGIERGIEQGIEQGIRKGKAALTVRQLQAQLGRLDARTRARIDSLPAKSLEDLGVALLEFETRKGMMAWLKEHARK